MTPEKNSPEEQRKEDLSIDFQTSEEKFRSHAEDLRRLDPVEDLDMFERVEGRSAYSISQRMILSSPDSTPEGFPVSPGDDTIIEPGVVSMDDPIVPQWRQMLRIFVSNRLAVVSLGVLIFIAAGCFLGKLVWHTNQTSLIEVLLQPHNQPPSWSHPLGTDNTGYDVLGRIMFGGEYSLTLGFLAGLITIFVGTGYGMISGYFGGAVDAIMMRIIDAFLSIPYLFFLISLIAVFGRSTVFLILVIGLTGWWGNARIIRSDALLIRDLEYSQAASSMGAKKLYIIRRHVFPNSMGNIVTVGTFAVADSILFLSALGFLGLSIEPPATDWGTMLNAGVPTLFNGFWWEVFPVTIVFITVVVCINYIGDALRDIFEVRYRGR